SLAPFRVEFTNATGASVASPLRTGFVAFSPDGHWLAYSSTESGEAAVFIRSFPDGKTVRQVATGGAIEPRWKPNGDLYYRNGHRWYVTRVTTTPTLTWSTPRLVFDAEFIDTPGMSYDVSNDGQRLLV